MRIGINGMGRIGRIALRAAMIKAAENNLTIGAINDLMPIDRIAHLIKYDSVHGKFPGPVSVDGTHLQVGSQRIRVTHEEDPEKIDWSAAKVTTVLECTGIFKDLKKAGKHLTAGAERVITSAPGDGVPMFVMGVNHQDLKKDQKILSNASCTTNCLAPLVKVLDDHFTIEEALMTTVHATTGSQSTVDSAAKKNLRIGRSSLNNIIPTSTGAAEAVTTVLPQLKNKITGMAFRVPVADVSVVDLTVRLKTATSLSEINRTVKNEAENDMQGILGYTEEELVSQDFVSDTRTSIYDAEAGIQLNPNFYKLIAWYDNEFGYATKLVDLAMYIPRK